MTQHLPDQTHTEQAVNVSAFSGAILGLQGDVLHGWAIDNVQPDRRPAIEVFVDGASVALTRADQYEPNAPLGDQYNGFSVQLRQHWIDGARLITAKVANQPSMLKGQVSLPVTPNEDSASIVSQVWHTGGLRIGGWCWDPKLPNRHVTVTVRGEDGLVISQALCNKHNQVLAYRATSDHGFAIDLPWELADGKVHVLEIVNDLGKPLAGSPIRLCCWPEGIEGLVIQHASISDESIKNLIVTVAKEQELHLPKSSGWKSYPSWFEAFQRLNDKDTPILQGKIGLLLISEGDTDIEKISLASLGTNRNDVHKLAIASSKNVAPAVEILLSSGCDRILPIHAGDRLTPFALPHLSALLDDGSAWAFADCDRDGPQSERSFPWLKPVWDIDLFIGADIFTPGAIFGKRIISNALMLLSDQTDRETIGWYDLVAGVALATEYETAGVKHLPYVLYHRAYSAPGSPEQAEPLPQRLQAIEWLCNAMEPGTKVSRVPGFPALLRAHWPLPRILPRVSLIVPTRDQYKLLHACIEGLLQNTDYPNLEIIVVDNQSSDSTTIKYLEKIKKKGVTILDHPYPFNYSNINNRAVRVATGEIIGLINNDIEIIESDWLKEMIAQLNRPGVGAVGAKLLWPNHMVQHGGVVVGINGLAAHTGNTLEKGDPGYLGMNQVVRRQSAVTAACLLVKKSVFEEVGGLDESAFPVAFNDVDLCLRIKQKGMHIIWSPFAQLIHAESASRGKDQTPEKRARAIREQTEFTERWCTSSSVDDFYHPALNSDYLSGPYSGLALPPRTCTKTKIESRTSNAHK